MLSSFRDSNLIDFQIDLEKLLKYATLSKEFRPFAKYPPVVEDITIISNSKTDDIIKNISLQSNEIAEVTLKDTYQNSRTFHIVYLNPEKNLTKQDVSEIRKKIISSLENELKATIK